MPPGFPMTTPAPTPPQGPHRQRGRPRVGATHQKNCSVCENENCDYAPIQGNVLNKTKLPIWKFTQRYGCASCTTHPATVPDDASLIFEEHPERCPECESLILYVSETKGVCINDSCGWTTEIFPPRGGCIMKNPAPVPDGEKYYVVAESLIERVWNIGKGFAPVGIGQLAYEMRSRPHIPAPTDEQCQICGTAIAKQERKRVLDELNVIIKEHLFTEEFPRYTGDCHPPTRGVVFVDDLDSLRNQQGRP